MNFGIFLQRENPWTGSTVRWTGGALRSMVDCGRRGHSAWRRLTGAWHTSAAEL
jgi:hypothetical protein